MTERDYIVMLKDSLDRKLDILEQIYIKSKLQTAILKDPNSSAEELEANLDSKAKLIDRIVKLDEGFDNMFSKVKDTMKTKKSEYAEEIKDMQDTIRKITDMSMNIKALEESNKELATQKFSAVRSQIRENRLSGKMVSNYYNNMMSQQTMEPTYLDNKK